MSKAATGQNGALLGTTAYFGGLNQGALLTGYLSDSGGYSYRGALEGVASAAEAILDEVYGDLREHESVLRYIPAEGRNRLAGLVTALSDLCSMVSPDTGMARECLSMLTLSGFTGMSRSMASDSELERGAEVIRTGGESGLDSFSRASTVKEAVQWGETFAVGADDVKRFFLQELKHEQATGFLADVWDYYNYRENPGEYCGQNGCAFCADGYTDELESRLFPRSMVSSFLQIDYAGNIKSELQDILRQIETDVAAARGENDYLADGEGERLGEAVDELERCGVLCGFSLKLQIDQLCWYTPLDGHKIFTLQQHLNQLGLGNSLKEDGVYGEKTGAATRQFYDWLANGRFPSVNAVEPVEMVISVGDTVNTGLEVGEKFYTATQGPVRNQLWGLQRLRTALEYKITANGNRVRRPAMIPGYRQISQQTYNMLKRFEGIGKVVKIANKVFIVAGVALETIEMLSEINADLNDADGKIGAATGRAVGGFAGSMAGMAVSFVAGAIISGATIASAPALVVAGIATLVVGAVAGPTLERLGELAGEAIVNGMETDIVDISDLANERA